MQAIVSALDDPHREMVENIWGELKAVFGLQGVIGSTRPHVTYHVAESYDAARIGDALAAVARARCGHSRLRRTASACSAAMRRCCTCTCRRRPRSRRCTAQCGTPSPPIATGPKPVYGAATWVPHITLASGDLTADALPLALQFLNRREYRWTIAITNVCLIDDTNSAPAAWQRSELRARREVDPG